MTMTYKTVSGTVTRPDSNVGIRAKVTVTPLSTNHALTFTGDDRITVGPVVVETSSSGVLPALKIPTNVDLPGLVWRITAEAIDPIPGMPKRWTVKNAVSITGTGTALLRDLAEVDVLTVDATVVASVSDYASAADASKTAAAGSATTAAGWADAAASSAADADTSADLADTSADTATTAASTATTKATEASTSATTATTKASEAAASASHAEDMAGAAEAVAVSNDTIIAGRINDPASATATALTASVADIRKAAKISDPWWDEVFAAPPSTDVPTISTASSSQISGGTTTAATTSQFYDPTFRYDGCTSIVASGGFPGAPSNQYLDVETITDATDMEFQFRAGRTGTGVMGVRVIVNGKWVMMTGVARQMLRVGGTSGSDVFIRLVFGTAKLRHIRIEQDGFNLFRGIVTGTKTVLRAPTNAIRRTFVDVGDSLKQGGPDRNPGVEVSGDYFYFSKECHGRYQAALLGCDSYINLGVGGTGWSTVQADTFATRTPLALSASPSILSYTGSRNDSGHESEVIPAILIALSQAAAVPVVMVGGVQQAGFSTLSGLIEQGARASRRVYLNLDGVIAAPSSNPTGHPTFAEQVTIAQVAHSLTDPASVIAACEAAYAARITPTVTLTRTGGPSLSTGTATTLTATVTGASGGTVQFYLDGAAIGSPVTVVSGTATYTLSAPADGAHTISATYLPANVRSTRTATSATLNVTWAANLGFSDTLARATGNIGTSSSGKVWGNLGTSAIFQITASGETGVPTASSNSFAVLAAGTTDGTFKLPAFGGTVAGGAGIAVLRAQSSSSHLYLNNGGSGGRLKMWKRVAGTSTALVNTLGATSGAAGTVFAITDAIEFVLLGHTVTLKQNGTAIETFDVTDFDSAMVTSFGAVSDNFGLFATALGKDLRWKGTIEFIPAA